MIEWKALASITFVSSLNRGTISTDDMKRVYEIEILQNIIMRPGHRNQYKHVKRFVHSAPRGGNLVLPCCGTGIVAWPQIVRFKTVWAPDGLPPPSVRWLLAEDRSRPFSQIPYQYQSSDGDCLKRMESSSVESLSF